MYSHYLNQWWPVVYWTLKNKLQSNFNLELYIQQNVFENVVTKMSTILFKPQCVNSLCTTDIIQCHRLNMVQVMACYLMASTYYLNPCLTSVRSCGIHVMAVLQKYARFIWYELKKILRLQLHHSGTNELITAGIPVTLYTRLVAFQCKGSLILVSFCRISVLYEMTNLFSFPSRTQKVTLLSTTPSVRSGTTCLPYCWNTMLTSPLLITMASTPSIMLRWEETQG